MRFLFVTLLFFAYTSTAETIRIGLTLPLTGTQKAGGEEVLSATKATVEHLNKIGGFGPHKVELMVRDDSYDATKTKLNTEKLADEGAHLMFGMIGAKNITTTLPSLKERNISLFAPLSGPSTIYDKQQTGGFIVPFRSSYHDEIAAVAKFLRGVGLTRVGLIYQDDTFGVDLLNAWKKEAAAGGITLVNIVPVPRESDPTTEQIKLSMAGDVNVVSIALITATAKKAVGIIKSLYPAPPQMFVASVAVTADFESEVRKLGTSVNFSSVLPLADLIGAGVRNDFHELQTTYKFKSGLRGMEAYIAMRLLAESIKGMSAKNISKQGLREALSDVKKGRVGDFFYSQDARFADVFAVTKHGYR
jgi:branched-chain amino acid transport system substrate-binding protein